MIALEELRRAHGALKATALTRLHVATLHFRMADRPYAANRAVAVWSKAFAWAAGAGLVPEAQNPAKNIKRYREPTRERFLTSEELARLGEALREGETVGLPYSVDETKTTAKHAAKADHRRVKLDGIETSSSMRHLSPRAGARWRVCPAPRAARRC